MERNEMDETKMNVKDVMQTLNITSKKDFDLVINYLASVLQSKNLGRESEKKDVLKFTDNRKPPSEREKNLYNINALGIHYDFIYNIWRSQLYPSLKAIDSPLASKLYDRFTDGAVFLSNIKKTAEKQLLPGEEARID
ncbi:hypothetical protein CTZ24_05295 [Pantoea phytobeneficialis]|uniref:Uncharacterized protein n=1 Tax=Pantoea phytobeneficialis TaxID=2052056 RepID=A0AAP9H3J7_9GAMM|nr:hypothetical protein [Pantoea phytobeneficialis]MDO6408088.1 hypothetical protein [Pantoea phytobeneficialis]QGR05854.1 hypothetical protein CTZ24_05295 [Pantoea phytobeneficialis]